ncbi:class I mannose-6-phosphate isomerase [Paenibacillus chibensis]|uniref:class I mannose-6-phosphate isomerase n=1 Tax=Paenibacillus chibensis TaxID=59846 RepID=UPI000FDC177C|nr:class I mannose-6-phosphate isomerase [Paenibacillus chibensis]MEC0369137.1 class I mannose-6-phosphate isomerase [Paenibacillus chibensis]
MNTTASPSFNPLPINSIPLHELPEPELVLNGFSEGYEAIMHRLADMYKHHDAPVFAVAIDAANGAPYGHWVNRLKNYCRDRQIPWILIETAHYMHPPAELLRKFQPYLTDNRAFGRIASDVREESYFQDGAQESWQCDVRQQKAGLKPAFESGSQRPGPIPVVVTAGPGALFLCPSPDASIYCDLSRENQQALHRQGLGSLGLGECADPVETYKQALFLEWPVWENYRRQHLHEYDVYVDMNKPEAPVCAALPALRPLLAAAARRPFRVKPFFAPGIWGGQYLKELCGLPPDWRNCAWSFEPIGPENTLLIECSSIVIEVPFPLLLSAHPEEILGRRNVELFGDYFPIRFDYLDTIDGDNLSLQVHPQQEYIERTFNETMTQQESYYIMEQKPGSSPVVALGFKDGTSGDGLLQAVDRAHETQQPLDIAQYVNVWKARKGDLYLIPPGAVHFSGRDNLVLEISSTTWWFTFKIYDHLRLDQDGRPRPINRDHAAHNMIDRFDTAYVREHLIAKPAVTREQGNSTEELLGERDDLLFQVKRLRLAGPWEDHTEGGFVMYNLVEGSRVRLIPEGDEAAAVEWGYAEAYIVPASTCGYRLEPVGPAPCTLIRAQVSPGWHTPLLPHHWKPSERG